MNLLELKEYVDTAIENAKEFDENPEEIKVSIQIDRNDNVGILTEDVWTEEIELVYDNNTQASGCVIHGWETNNKI